MRFGGGSDGLIDADMHAIGFRVGFWDWIVMRNRRLSFDCFGLTVSFYSACINMTVSCEATCVTNDAVFYEILGCFPNFLAVFSFITLILRILICEALKCGQRAVFVTLNGCVILSRL